jgi:hypothetical protein
VPAPPSAVQQINSVNVHVSARVKRTRDSYGVCRWSPCVAWPLTMNSPG